MSQQETLSKPDICSLCLSSCDGNGQIYPIRSCSALRGSSERYDLLTLVFKAISVTICSDGRECKICNSCDKQLSTTLQFLEMCKKSEESLDQHLVETEFTIKLEKMEDPEPSVEVYFHETEPSTPEKTKTCEICSKTFLSARQLNIHVAKSHTKKKKPRLPTGHLSCDFCRKKFFHKTVLTKHLQKHILVPVECFCGKKFASKLLQQRHAERMHNPMQFKCSHCEKPFRTKAAMKSHENTHRAIKPLLCTSCPLAYSSVSGLLAHQQRHHSVVPWVGRKKQTFLCDTCGSSFSRKFHLQRHVYHIHTQNLQRSFSCSQCDKAFPSKDRLKNHARIHNPRNLACPECDRTFVTSYMLKMHIGRIHLQLRPFPCTTCDKTFKVKSHLDKHLRTHTGEKPHQCPFCSYKCAEKSNLQKHVRVHDRKN